MVVAAPAGTTPGRAARALGRRLTRTLAITVLIGACGPPAPSASPIVETCVELSSGQAVGLSWSQTGRFLGIGTTGPNGSPGAQVMDAEGRAVGSRIAGRDLLPTAVAVTPDGRLVWLERDGSTTKLVEDRAEGIVETPLPEGVDGLAWTAIGFALLQHPADGGTRVLNLDVDRPEAPTLSYATNLFAERLWISADPESMVLTIAHPDHRDAPSSFQVILANTEHQLEPAGADASGASMPASRRWIVYRSSTTSHMEAVTVADPGSAVTLRDRGAKLGMVSDRGILAFVPDEPDGQVCLTDVAALLP